MLNFAGLFFLLVAHYFSGKGILRLFDLKQKPVINTCLSFIIGVPVISLVPCVVQLMKMPITQESMAVGVVVCTVLCAIPLVIKFRNPEFSFKLPEIYELPFFLVYLTLVVTSVWRCYYYPPTARDMLSGPELIAEYAIREKTMISSIYSIDLQTTNNYLKSPFITGLQILYKLFVQPFGQLWISVLFIAFTVWVYDMLKARIHPVIAGALLLCFFAIPDLFAYSYVMLYDYSNMVFFFCGFYFLGMYLQTWRMNDFIFSAFLLGLATYIRTETLIFVYLAAPLIIYYYYRQKFSAKKWATDAAIFALVPLAFYWICNNLFVAHFVPISFDPSSQVNHNLGDLSPIFKRFSEINSYLLFSKMGETIYGDFIYMFMIILAIDIIWPRKFNKESLIALYGAGLIYIGLPILGYLLPLADLTNTTKRSFFKMLPMLLWYMANSGLLLRISGWIKNWEHPAAPAQKKSPAVAAANSGPKAQKRKGG